MISGTAQARIAVFRARNMVRSIFAHASGRIGLMLVVPILVAGIAAPLFLPYDPLAVAAGAPLEGPTLFHLFGTDQLGRDQLARVTAAIPVAFEIAVGSVVIATLVGGFIGVVAGYSGGVVERGLMAISDVLLALPALLMAILIVAVFGGGVVNTAAAISLIYIPRFARIARASTLTLRGRPFVDAARLAGTPRMVLVLRHIVPGIAPSLIVMATLSLSTALLAQAALSFLGLGITPPTPDLGRMLATATDFLQLAPWLAVFPGLVIVALVLGFNLLGDAVREVVDPAVADSSAQVAV